MDILRTIEQYEIEGVRQVAYPVPLWRDILKLIRAKITSGELRAYKMLGTRLTTKGTLCNECDHWINVAYDRYCPNCGAQITKPCGELITKEEHERLIQQAHENPPITPERYDWLIDRTALK